MKRILIVLLALAFLLSAAFVDQDRAQKVAENYYQNYAPVSAKGNVVQKILTKEYLGQPTWYVFQFTKGWVIVSADDNVRPILGYSFDGKIDEDIYNMDNPFVARFSAYDRQIVHVIREQGLVVKTKQKEWKDIENSIFPTASSSKAFREPLLETTWHQNYPFNSACPTGCPTGSVATAMAQIMRCHQSPRTGWGSITYTDNSGDSTGVHLINYDDQYYDWSLMLTLDGNDLTQEEIDEISKLNYQVGVSAKTDYNTDFSTADLEDARNAFDYNFGYGWKLGPSPVYEYHGTIYERSYFSETIEDNINAQIPILWSGFSENYGSHAFVLDGYDIDASARRYLYHFNWGWASSYDGWFELNDLTLDSSDFAFNQECVYELKPYSPQYLYCPPDSVTATITDLENVTLEWKWDYPEYLILSRFEISKDGEIIEILPDSSRIFYDSNVSVGEHTYTIEAVYGYEYYPEVNSANRGITVNIVPEDNFPVPYFTQEASVELYNRQKIELAWAKPFSGTEYLIEDFETSAGSYQMVTEGWIQKGDDNFPPTSWNDLSDSGWKFISKNGGTYYDKYVYEGYWAAYCDLFAGDTNPPFTYFISSEELSMTGDPVLSFWLNSATLDTDLQIVKYTGDFSEADPSLYTELIATVSPDTINTWEYKYVHLPEDNYRIGIVKDTSVGWSIIDNVFLGSDPYPNENQPVSYDIYRNDKLADNIPVTGLYEQYEDRTFTEDWNKYHIRAVYPTGTSLKSKSTKVYIDANPVPLALSGSYDFTNDEVDLSWYYPGHYPPHWFGYIYENDTFSYQDWDYDNRYLLKNITIYDPLEFDMTFPIHIEKVGASFFEDAANDNFWTSDQFRFLIVSGPFWSDSLIYSSPWLTADPSGDWCDHKLPETLTLNENWYVAVELGDPATGTPSIVLNNHVWEDNPVWHSLKYHSSSPTTAGTWTALNYMDYSILCYGYNDKPEITKYDTYYNDTNVSNIATEQCTNSNFINIKLDREDRFYTGSTDSKALESYNIYRDEMLLDNTTNKFYSDVTPLGIANYYVTTVYTDPVGESVPSNVIVAGSTGIEGNIPYKTSLEQNYPNPFNPTTSINFSIMSDNDVKLKVYNSSGQLVSILVNKFMNQGAYKVTLDASRLSGGVYLYTLEVNGAKYSKKMILVK